MTAALLALSLAAGGAQPAGAGRRLIDVAPDATQRASSDPVREVPFGARADEELLGARLALELAPQTSTGPRVLAVEVVVNDETVARLAPPRGGDPEPHDVSIDPALLAPRNSLALRLQTRRDGRCAEAPGGWEVVRSARLALRTGPVPLPDDLALLPLPFVDRGFDASAEVPLVTGPAPSRDHLRAAALVASWLAVDEPLPVEVIATPSLPDGAAVVLVAGAADAARLGLEPPRGPSIRMIDHPLHPASNAKLVVIAGRDAAELRSAAETLARGRPRLAGPELALPAVAQTPPAPRDSAPRWVPPGRAVRFDAPAVTSSLGHDGTAPGTLYVRFRLAPDLWIWPADAVTLELGWTQRRPATAAPPRLDVELNGHFVATLPSLPAGDARDRVRLRIPREHMRGFNELLVHVRSPDHDPCAPAGSGAATGGGRHVGLLSDSALHVEKLARFAELPDVAAFALDGSPFALVPDLGETAIVLPDRPAPEELSIALSAVAQLAQITGRTATRVTVLRASDADERALAGKDLLVVAAGAPRWRDLLPVRFDGRRPVPRRPAGAHVADLLGGLGPLLDLRRARAAAAGVTGAAALAAIESPVTPGRTALVVTAGSPRDLPRWRDFRGYAESRARSGDLLLVAGDRRWMFRLGSTWGRGSLGAWTQLRWSLASHWIALAPIVLGGALALAAVARRGLEERMRARLAPPPPSPRLRAGPELR